MNTATKQTAMAARRMLVQTFMNKFEPSERVMAEHKEQTIAINHVISTGMIYPPLHAKHKGKL